mmetsp:Transcript_20050/g.34107  ORF Transcript_20050/g.34107 Transcript_20050/m.34107 type:complete len:306 (+) Transcript_20050:166-1083(+)
MFTQLKHSTRVLQRIKGLRSGLVVGYKTSIDLSQLHIIPTDSPKEMMPREDLMFGKSFSDHMLEVDWDADQGWHDPVISKYHFFNISPAATALHYGIECFEGMKAYKDANGDIRLFRPEKNMARFNSSMERLAMPTLDQEGFLACLKALLRQDASWVPEGEGYSIYIRPTAIGTSPYLGVEPSNHVKVYAILSPVGPYYKSGFKPVKLFADTTNARAWPGGVGAAKVGGNYGPTILPSKQASEKHGSNQVLWLYGEDHQITEVGAGVQSTGTAMPAAVVEVVVVVVSLCIHLQMQICAWLGIDYG